MNLSKNLDQIWSLDTCFCVKKCLSAFHRKSSTWDSWRGCIPLSCRYRCSSTSNPCNSSDTSTSRINPNCSFSTIQHPKNNTCCQCYLFRRPKHKVLTNPYLNQALIQECLKAKKKIVVIICPPPAGIGSFK